MSRFSPTSRPVIGITLGDPAGIGPEIIAKALQSEKLAGVEFRLIGSAGKITPGRLTLESGRTAYAALRESVELLKSGRIDAVVNGPVNKANLHQAGFHWPGQTEFYAGSFGLEEPDVTMVMTSPSLKVALVSTHCSLMDAVKHLNADGIVAHGKRLNLMLRQLGIRKPKIAVCGLNPHAGESGLFGNEEAGVILPAIRRLNRPGKGLFSGPHSPDAVFGPALKGLYDGVLCMYHDQGLIPFKMVAFEEGVNLTLGLPVVRVAPDHGTALDIAGKGKANPSSMRSALRLAVHLLTRNHTVKHGRKGVK